MVTADNTFRVALTFDAEHPDRPTVEDVHDRIISILERQDVRATFFVQGRWAQAYPARARALPGLGHLVGSHSFYHVRMPLLSRAGLRNDVEQAERAIRDIVKVDPRPWFRLPFGSGATHTDIHSGLGALGYRHVHWDVEAKEWRTRVTAGRVADESVAGASAIGDGAILLMHSWPRTIPGALDQVIRRLRDAGATFVRVDELPGR
ncbi:MAG: polysaccharide deacetylase family protein [Chloroflexota bacterium]|nr:MAG: polysaccharide deacetylase family protein [Chloroflexota bacterium]